MSGSLTTTSAFTRKTVSQMTGRCNTSEKTMLRLVLTSMLMEMVTVTFTSITLVSYRMTQRVF